MAEVAEHMFHGFSATFQKSPLDPMYDRQRMMMVGNEEADDDLCDSTSGSVDTSVSDASSSLDSTDEVTSSSSTSPPQMASSGPLYELSSLMATLPIKRGLSKYFQGKSQSFTSLSRVTSVEDLVKKEIPYKRKMKSCKSYAAGLDCHKITSTLGTKSTITKKASRVSCSSLAAKRNGSFLGGKPPIPLQKGL